MGAPSVKRTICGIIPGWYTLVISLPAASNALYIRVDPPADKLSTALINESLSFTCVVGIIILDLLLNEITDTKSVGPNEFMPAFTASLAW